mgnify:CR=1 FL=1
MDNTKEARAEHERVCWYRGEDYSLKRCTSCIGWHKGKCQGRHYKDDETIPVALWNVIPAVARKLDPFAAVKVPSPVAQPALQHHPNKNGPQQIYGAPKVAPNQTSSSQPQQQAGHQGPRPHQPQMRKDISALATAELRRDFDNTTTQTEANGQSTQMASIECGDDTPSVDGHGSSTYWPASSAPSRSPSVWERYEGVQWIFALTMLAGLLWTNMLPSMEMMELLALVTLTIATTVQAAERTQVNTYRIMIRLLGVGALVLQYVCFSKGSDACNVLPMIRPTPVLNIICQPSAESVMFLQNGSECFNMDGKSNQYNL